MVRKPIKKPRLSGVIIFSTPSTSAHNVVDNWIEHRIVEPEEFTYFSINKKDLKNVNKTKCSEFVEMGSREPVMSASSLGLHL